MVCIQGGLHPGGSTSRGSVLGGSALGPSASGGGVSASGGGLPPGGGDWAYPSSDTTGYGQRPGGTHPTGMYSCSQCTHL